MVKLRLRILSMKKSGHSKTKANDLSIVYLTTESKLCSFKGRETKGRSG